MNRWRRRCAEAGVRTKRRDGGEEKGCRWPDECNVDGDEGGNDGDNDGGDSDDAGTMNTI
jgi:hypothetical protein